MASVLKVQRKTRAGTTADGKPIWAPAKGVLWYGKVKTLEGAWVQVPTHKPTKATAAAWASNECACDKCGGPDRIRRRREEEAAASRAAEQAKNVKTAGELMQVWIATLTTRDLKNDRNRHKNYLAPKFGGMRLDEITLPVVMHWIDELRAVPEAERLSEGTMRQLFNLLSRFFSWAIERGHVQVNPCRMVPMGKRPQGQPKTAERPWIADDRVVRDLMNVLKSPFREMFFIQNRSGLRPGEVRGLRMSDIGHTDEEGNPVIRVRYSDEGPLKEDKKTKTGPSRPKWAPQPDDFGAVLGPFLEQRQAEGAGPEDFVFGPRWLRSTLKFYAEEAWRVAAETLRIPHKQYEGGRHSMVTRNLSRTPGAMPEVSKAIGHASVTTTEEHYDHVVIPRFSPGLREGLRTAKLRSV